jgi:hypothetical protein
MTEHPSPTTDAHTETRDVLRRLERYELERISRSRSGGSRTTGRRHVRSVQHLCWLDRTDAARSPSVRSALHHVPGGH